MAEMPAEPATVPIVEMCRPVMAVMAVVHRVMKVVPVKIVSVKIMKAVKVAAKKSVAETERAVSAVRHGVRCRERGSKYPKSGNSDTLSKKHRVRLRDTCRPGIIGVHGGKFDRPWRQMPEIVKRQNRPSG
jgi:hypothetical protein